jgi:hypothetical protein
MVLEFDERHFRLDATASWKNSSSPHSSTACTTRRACRAAGASMCWCVLYGLALASVIIYAPTFFKDLFALRIGKNIKRMWQDAHNAIGIRRCRST